MRKEKMITKNDVIERVKALENDAKYFTYTTFPKYINITIFNSKRLKNGTLVPREYDNPEAVKNFLKWLETSGEWVWAVYSREDNFYLYETENLSIYLTYSNI